MKKIINQCTFLPIRQRESLATWYRSSALCIGAIGALLLSINAVQCWHLAKEINKKNKIAAENQQDILITQEKTQLEQKKAAYATCFQTVRQSQEKNATVHALLNTISTIIPEDIALAQINYQSNNEILITGQSLHLTSLNQFITKLKNQTKSTAVSIASLNHRYDTQLKKELINFKVVVTL